MPTEETKRRIHLTKTGKRGKITESLRTNPVVRHQCYDCGGYFKAPDMYKSDTISGFGARCKECGLKYDSERKKRLLTRRREKESGLITLSRPALVELVRKKVLDPKDLPRYGLLKAVLAETCVFISFTDYAFLQGYFYSHE